MNKEIVGTLHEGKIILDIYKEHGYPTGGPKYKEFMYEVGKALGKMKYHHFGVTMGWLYSQEGNNLPYPSSGSTRVALEDFDNFISGMGGEDVLTEEEYQFAHKVYKALFS